MRSARLIALALIAGCARSGTDLFTKIPPPDAPADAFVVPAPDAFAPPPDATVDAMPDAASDATAGDGGPPDAN